MLKSLQVKSGEDVEKYICVHWRTFPPPGAGQNIEALRASQSINSEQYNRLKLWDRICGLFNMEESKCMSCPHRRKIIWKVRGPYLLAPDGTESPIVDAATGESNPRERDSHLATIFRRPGTRGSHKPAAWTREGGEGGGDG